MIRTTLSFLVIATLGNAISSSFATDTQVVLTQPSQSLRATCQQIAASVSTASQIYDFTSSNYYDDIDHWASSSTQFAACSFEPATLEDVGIALQILGQTRTPFAVKGGGHSTNPGFSSTSGVQIAMSRFADVTYDPAAQTATIGAGLIWDKVYEALEPQGVNVVGGRVPGVGVAGFILGGGYSWLTNQYGLTIDTVQNFELVMPNGTAINVTDTSSPDLFFALKGGLNNFGIVTRFTLKTFPQTQVWGGLITYTENVLDQVNQATANFAADNVDPKAAIITSYNFLLGEPGVSELIFYDGPTPPAGIFDEFLSISPFTIDISTRSFVSFIQSLPGWSTTRAVFNSISVTNYQLSFLQSVLNETIYWGGNLPEDSVVFISYDVEPFLPTLFTHNPTPSAYPPDRTQALYPLNLYYAWLSAESDSVVENAIRTSAQRLQADTSQNNAANAAVYPNYAIFDTPLDKLYGANIPRLQAIRKAVDPGNVMGLAGGFKL